MKKYFVYILICSDESYYIGITNDIMLREEQHNMGLDNKAYTFDKRPVKLVWYQEFVDPNEAILREKQLKGWSRKKKEALISGDYDRLPELSKNSTNRFDRLSVTTSILKNSHIQNPFYSLTSCNMSIIMGQRVPILFEKIQISTKDISKIIPLHQALF